jgi:predicted Zn-dependent protease with MMP-like domain
MTLSDELFESFITEALDSLPEERVKGLINVAIVYEDEPSPEQRQKLHLRGSQTLFGLYEGIPLTKRAQASSLFSGTPMTLPDKITIFKLPIASNCSSIEQVKEQVKHTLWHEIAHYYGLDHRQIRERE